MGAVRPVTLCTRSDRGEPCSCALVEDQNSIPAGGAEFLRSNESVNEGSGTVQEHAAGGSRSQSRNWHGWWR